MDSFIKTRMMMSLLSGAFLFGCGKSEDSEKGISGFSWTVKFVRAIDQTSFAPVAGEQQWWFFKSAVFRQEASEFIETDFYDEKVACSGTASGRFTLDKISDNQFDSTLTYETFGASITGLCRMADRKLKLVLQPSGYLDIYDGVVVQRAERLKEIY